MVWNSTQQIALNKADLAGWGAPISGKLLVDVRTPQLSSKLFIFIWFHDLFSWTVWRKDVLMNAVLVLTATTPFRKSMPEAILQTQGLQEINMKWDYNRHIFIGGTVIDLFPIFMPIIKSRLQHGEIS